MGKISFIFTFIILSLVCIGGVEAASYVCKSFCINSICSGTYPALPQPGTCWDVNTVVVSIDDQENSATCNGGEGYSCNVYVNCVDCLSTQVCSNGKCVASCIPDCIGKVCGDDGCGGVCGTCLSGQVCSGGQCVASVPIIFGKPSYCTLPSTTFNLQTGLSTTTCEIGTCWKVSGDNLISTEFIAAEQNKEYILLVSVNASNLQTWFDLDISFYDSNNNQIVFPVQPYIYYLNDVSSTVTCISGCTVPLYIKNTMNSTFNSLKSIQRLVFSTPANTAKIKIKMKNDNRGLPSVGYTLVSPIYLGLRASCTETDCNDGVDEDFDSKIDMEDEDCRVVPNCISWQTPIFYYFWSQDNLFRSSSTGSDGCCGDDVLNGDFEILDGTIIDGWEASTGTTISQSKDNIMTGKYSLLATSTAPSEWQSVNSDVLIPIEINTNYILSGDIYLPQDLPSNSWVSLIAHGYDATKIGTLTLNNQSIIITEKGKYHIYLNIESQYLSTTKYINVILGIYNLPDGNSVYFDNIHFEKVNSNFPTLEDYGFINSNGYGYLCYNYNGADLTSSTTIPVWAWLDAGKDPFKIITIGTLDGTTDVISNSANWSYCDATGNGKLNGIPIKEYGTFGTSYQSLKDMQCYEFLNLVTENDAIGLCTGQQSTWKNCCRDGTINIYNSNTFGQCACYGEDGAGDVVDFCDIDALKTTEYCKFETETSSTESDFVEKSLCEFDLSGCLNETYFNSALSCSEQNLPSGYTKQLCIPGKTYCDNGKYISTKEEGDDVGKKCCVGIGASNLTLPTIDSEITCVYEGFTAYDYTDGSLFCQDYVSIPNSNKLRCCLDEVVQTDLFDTKYLGAISNESFICFKQEGNNLLGDCCFGSECANLHLLGEGYDSAAYFIDIETKRLFGKGNLLHTISNYDKYESSSDQIVDYVRRITTTGEESEFSTKNNIWIDTKLNLKDFTYLEFDMAHNNPNASNLGLIINNENYGKLSQYFNNGDEDMRWHHAIIKLNQTHKDQNQKIESIEITSNQETTFIIDNIILTPSTDADLDVNSKNYYCTGGFGTWISDLDPNWTKYTSSDDFWSDWKSYGQYKFACEAQGSYGWTGHQCCGDDTKLDNYGEIFNDTQAGCFNGTYMMNNWTIWDAKNIADWKTEFNDYYYNDLLYIDNQFIGCQIENGKYNSLNTSIDGNTLNNKNIVQSFVNTQCQQIGRYYCMNNAWHKEVVAEGGALFIMPGMDISIKHSPPGSEIIINGDFGGDALPDTIIKDTKGELS